MKAFDLSQRQKQTVAEILKTVFICLLILDLILFVNAFIFQFVNVRGDSMTPSICEKDILLINKFSNPDSYNRYDIIVFKPYSEDDITTSDEDESRILYIKRIIGLPGETVTVHNDGSISVIDKNGISSILTDDIYASSKTDRGINWVLEDDNIFETVTLAEDEFFVLGDNRGVSLDSRSVRVQAVHKSSILGKFTLRVFPFSR